MEENELRDKYFASKNDNWAKMPNTERMAYFLLMEILPLLKEFYYDNANISSQLEDSGSPLMQKYMSMGRQGYMDVTEFVNEYPMLMLDCFNVDASSDTKLWYERRLFEMKSRISNEKRKEIYKQPLDYQRIASQSLIDGYDSSVDGVHAVCVGISLGDEYHFYLKDWIDGLKIAKYLPIYEEELEKFNKVSSNLKEELNHKIEPTKIDIKSIEPIWWIKTKEQLKYFLTELANKGFINKDDDINQIIKQHFIDENRNRFKINGIANAKDFIDVIYQPIRWKSKKTLLVYLMDKVIPSGLVHHGGSPDKMLLQHFVDQKRDKYKPNIKQVRNYRTKNTKNSIDLKDLDNIIAATKNHNGI